MFIFRNLPSSYGNWNKFAGLIETRFKLCLKSALCLFRAHFLKLPGHSRACQLTRTVFRLLFWAQSTKLPKETEISFQKEHWNFNLNYNSNIIIIQIINIHTVFWKWKLFHEECERLKEIFSRLCYPDDLVQSIIRRLIESKVSEDSHTRLADKREAPVRIVLP